jgi:hypothetical protein
VTSKTHSPAQGRKEEPQVGIFWLVDGKPIIDSTPLSEAEDYDDFQTHPRSHLDVWGSALLIDKRDSENSWL